MTTPNHQPLDLPDYHVLVRQLSTRTTLAETGNGLETLHVIPYQIDSGPAKGSKRTVEVAGDQFTPADVEQAIREDLAAVHLIGQLGGGNA
jgi:hypothetical protein